MEDLKPLPTFEQWEMQTRATVGDMPVHFKEAGMIKGWLNCKSVELPDESEMIPLPAGDYTVYCGQDGFLRLNVDDSEDYYYVKLGEFEMKKNQLIGNQ